MKPKPSIRKSPPKDEQGFSLVELLVTLLLASTMLTLMTGFFRANVAIRQRMTLQTETQQGLRAVLEVITQELRQAGACLPQLGQFIALAGSDNGDQDSFTVRIGRTDPETLICVKAGTIAPAATAGDTTLYVQDSTGFEVGTLVYVTPNSASGDFYRVTGKTGTSITLDRGLAVVHPVGSGIYAVDERRYAIGTINGRQALTVEIDQDGVVQPLVDGVEELNVQYFLEPCPPCDLVDQPANDTEWRQVREVSIAATVRSHKENQDGEFAYESGQVNVKPRNLL